MRLDLLKPLTWERLAFPNTDVLNLPPEISDVQEFYKSRLPHYLRMARQLHRNLRNNPIIPGSRYVFSFQHETPDGLSAWNEKGSHKLVSEVTFGKRGGDGIVSADSAKDVPKDIDPDHMIRLDAKHEHLITDDNFIDMILQLKSTVSAGWEVAAAEMWIHDKEIVAQFADLGILLPWPAEIKGWSPASLGQYKCASDEDSIAMTCDKVREHYPLEYSVDNEVIYFDDVQSTVGGFNATVITTAAERANVGIDKLSDVLYGQIGTITESEWQNAAYLSYIDLQRALLEQGSGNPLALSKAWSDLGNTLLKQGKPDLAWFPVNNAYQISKLGLDKNWLVSGDRGYAEVFRDSTHALKVLEEYLGVSSGP